MSDDDICGGDLYRLQKEAAERARRTASQACRRDEPAPPCHPTPSCGTQAIEQRENKSLFGSTDAVIIGAIVLILINDGCKDTLLLLALAVLLIM